MKDNSIVNKADNRDRSKVNIILLLIAAGMLLLSLCLVLLLGNEKQEKDYPVATSVSDVLVGVKLDGTVEEIRPYYDIDIETGDVVDDTVYYFLPTGAKDEKIFFLNVPGGAVFDGLKIQSGQGIADPADFLEKTHILEVPAGEFCEKRNVIFMSSSQIGSVFIHTESGSLDLIHESKDNKEPAHLTVFDERGSAVYDESIAYIKGRGKYSFEKYDKKSYKIRLNSGSSIFGFAEADSFTLISNPSDFTRQRNRLAYEYANDFTDIPAPESKYIDLYINGEYRGNYLFCTDKDNLVPMTGASALEKRNDELRGEDGGDITGGYILEHCGNETDFVTDGGHPFEVIYPDNATESQVEYIKNLMNETEKAICSPNGVNPETGGSYLDYIDVDSWAEKFVMDELFAEPDKTLNGGGRSVFFYKFSDSVDTHIFAGPAWDYDLGTGFNAYVLKSNLNFSVGEQSYLGPSLMSRDEMMNAIKDKMTLASEWVEDNMSLTIRNDTRLITDSVAMDNIRWKANYQSSEYSSFEAEADYLRFYIRARRDCLTDAWLNGTQYHTVTFLDYEGNPCRNYRVRHGDTLPEIPVINSYIAIFDGWRDEKGKALIEWQPILEDTVFYSKWVDADLLAQNIESISGVDADQLDTEAMQAFINAVRMQQKEGVVEETER